MIQKLVFLWFLIVLANSLAAEKPTWEILVENARWAANAHNIQSWILNPMPGQPDQKILTLNPGRLLPETEPSTRQLTISLG